MKHLKRINENVDIEGIFYELKRPHDKSYEKEFEKGLNFLKTLNLTEDQYRQLANLLDEFGQFKYNQGDSNARYQEEY